MYEKPTLTKLGNFRELTQYGYPNLAYDGGAWNDPNDYGDTNIGSR